MHKNLPKYYYFVDDYNKDHIKSLNKNIAIIFRNYSKKLEINKIISINKFCKSNRRTFILANNIKLAIHLNLDGAYIPSYNKSFSHLAYNFKKKFLIIGSAHNLKEIRIKELQKIKFIFLSSIFRKNNNYLGINKFKNLTTNTDLKIVALGGINENNLKKLKLLNCVGFAAISFFNKKKAP